MLKITLNQKIFILNCIYNQIMIDLERIIKHNRPEQLPELNDNIETYLEVKKAWHFNTLDLTTISLDFVLEQIQKRTKNKLKKVITHEKN